MLSPLKKLGLKKNWIYEVVVTTGKSAAPMGFWTPDFERVMLRVYKTSGTYRNILHERKFAINFVEDVAVFYYSLFKKEKLRFKKIKNSDAPVLANVKSWILLEAVDVHDLGDSVEITAKIKKSKISKNTRLINRAEFLALECMIKATKRGAKKPEILEYCEKIKKVAPKSEYEKIVEGMVKWLK